MLTYVSEKKNNLRQTLPSNRINIDVRAMCVMVCELFDCNKLQSLFSQTHPAKNINCHSSDTISWGVWYNYLWVAFLPKKLCRLSDGPLEMTYWETQQQTRGQVFMVAWRLMRFLEERYLRFDAIWILSDRKRAWSEIFFTLQIRNIFVGIHWTGLVGMIRSPRNRGKTKTFPEIFRLK